MASMMENWSLWMARVVPWENMISIEIDLVVKSMFGVVIRGGSGVIAWLGLFCTINQE